MKCWICGKTATKTRSIGVSDGFTLVPFAGTHQRCYCDSCYAKMVAEKARDTKEYVRLRKKLMFERAVDILEHQRIDMYEYQEAMQAVQEFAAEQPDKFDSAYEMLAAIILINNRIDCKMQYKFGQYQVDFFLPTERVILEIDGERHTHRKGYDTKRDQFIKSQLGNDWEIIRVKTEYLDQHADRLVDAIRRVCDHRAFGF